jgi:CO/xanthine dehydrogenase Mo-binding subunit
MEKSSAQFGAGFKASARAPPAVRGQCHSLLRAIHQLWLWRTHSRPPKRGRCGPRDVRQDKPNVENDLKADDDPDVVATTFGPYARLESQRGDAKGAFASAAVKLDQTYVTPAETHNPLELHATTAIWDGSTLTLYESSQGVVNQRGVLAQMFGLPKENVRVITKFVGSGFGSKLWPWTQCPLAAAAARQLGKPVKLVLSRKMMFQSAGHRARTQQRVRLGAMPTANSSRSSTTTSTTGRCSKPTTKIAARLRRFNTACPTSA